MHPPCPEWTDGPHSLIVPAPPVRLADSQSIRVEMHRFTTDAALADAGDAARLAVCIGRTRRFTSHAVTIYLGGLESTDFARLDPQRQEAARRFWSAYFGNSGGRTEMRFDGTGMIQQFGN
jgi:hypothetical protein